MTERLRNDAELDDLLCAPSEAVTQCLGELDGDLIVLGVAGKMGMSLAVKAKRASGAAGVERRVIGVSRFSDSAAMETLQAAGVETIRCDLLRREQVQELPRAANVIYMAGRKFGTKGQESLTWATNIIAPSHVMEHYPTSRVVAFSTGCVYPFVSKDRGGCREDERPRPVGEYAQSCLGRERVFEHFAAAGGTPVCLLRLNYAIDLRYGVLHDIASRILKGEAVDVSMPHFNCIWQGDATSQALLALRACASPMRILNITGSKVLSTRDVAERLASALGRSVCFGGQEHETSFLSDASAAWERFGTPSVSVDQMIAWTAEWLLAGGRSLNLPTHFEVRHGAY